MSWNLLTQRLRARPLKGPQSGMSRREGFWERVHLDPWLLLLLLLVMAAGLLVLYSASGQRIEVVRAQGTRLLLALAVMVVVAQIAPTTLLRWAGWGDGGGVLTLMGGEPGGAGGRGAQRCAV